jgi:uncharacterized protein YwgA
MFSAKGGEMNKRELMLIALAPGKEAWHTPVQVQKLPFLIQKNVFEPKGEHIFDFRPYNYGPFDIEVYNTLAELAEDGSAEICYDGKMRTYRLTSKGLEEGNRLLSPLDPKFKKYIEKISDLVRTWSFTELVSAIYKAYPEMKINSVFQEG